MLEEKPPSGTPSRRSSTNTPDRLLTGPPAKLCQVLSQTAPKNESTSTVQNERLKDTPGRGLQGPGRAAPCATSCAPEETFIGHNTHRQCEESDTTDPPVQQDVGSAAERAVKPRAVQRAGPVHQTHRGMQSTVASAQARICCATWCVAPGEALGSG